MERVKYKALRFSHGKSSRRSTWYPKWREALERVITVQMTRDSSRAGTPEREEADRDAIRRWFCFARRQVKFAEHLRPSSQVSLASHVIASTLDGTSLASACYVFGRGL